MNASTFTARQHLTQLLIKQFHTMHELSSLAHLSERQVEDHLAHIIRSLARNPSQQFMVEEPKCVDCGYEFKNRTRLKRPSRCPQCRSEAITYPQFSISKKLVNKTKRDNA